MKNIIFVIFVLLLLVSCTDIGNKDSLVDEKKVMKTENLNEEDTSNLEEGTTMKKSLDNKILQDSHGEKNNITIVKDFGKGLVIKDIFENSHEFWVLYFEGKEILRQSKDYYSEPLSWEEPEKTNFLIIKKSGRVITEENIIFDRDNHKIYEAGPGGISQIEKGKSGIFVLLQHYGKQEIFMFDSKGNKQEIFSAKVLDASKSPEVLFDVNIYGFSLMTNKRVKVIFNKGTQGPDDANQEKIISF